MGDLTVLVVDDESRMRKLIRDFLIQKNFNILEAEDGERALKVYEENKDAVMEAGKDFTSEDIARGVPFVKKFFAEISYYIFNLF